MFPAWSEVAASCNMLLCPNVGFVGRAQGPVKEAVQAHWTDTFKAIVHQNRILASVHLRPIRVVLHSHKTYSLPKNTETWMVLFNAL